MSRLQLADEHIELVQQVCQYIDNNLEAMPTLDALSTHVNVSPFHLQRIFKRVMGITPRQYTEARRLECLKNELRSGENIADAMYNAGYSSSSRLYESSDARLGMTPATYSRGGQGMCIHYTIVKCNLGLLLVGMTERGICAVHLGDDEAELQQRVAREYPSARIERNRNQLCDWVKSLLDHLNGAHPHLELPLDIRATAFEWRVWFELQNIPYGETRTYSEIAAAIGHPQAIQAVEQAIYANPAVAVIPCHRAVNEDGSPGQYCTDHVLRSKQLLLENEQHIAHGSDHQHS